MKKHLIFVGLLALIFFLVMFFTNSDYGPSWDETLHFSRGQAYLNFFLTGKKEYPKAERKSFYQLDYHNGDFWFKENGGHPPVSDILAASFNLIFYQKLGILPDIYSYHLFNIVASTLLIFIVVFFAIITLGKFPAIIAYLTLFTYPLFFGEGHFNVKDPAETAFFASTIFFCFLALKEKKPLLIFLSFIFFGLGLGTKLNILFLPIILGLWLFIIYKQDFFYEIIKLPKKFWISSLLGIVLVVAIFTLSWPYLWEDLPQKIISVVKFYQTIGTETNYQPEQFYIFGFNIFPLSWILFTTPPIILLLSTIGIVSAFLNKKMYHSVGILWLIWMIVPILRVSVPGASIYGGVRQIMEFLPALALLSALGAWQILKWTKKYKKQILFKLLLVLIFIWPSYILIKMHPNQNVYFNFLIGGLKGAEEKNFPAWGNSYGNAYFQGIKWINENAPPDAKVSLIQGIEVNTPDILYRSDVNLNNKNWSGLERDGEYLIELTFNDTGRAFYFAWEYVDKFLDPVYELKVDDVAILKIWKNDLEHTKSTMKLREIPYSGNLKLSKIDNNLEIRLPETITLSRIELEFQQRADCAPVETSFVETSIDNISWIREKDWIPFPQVRKVNNLRDGGISYYFAAREAKAIRFVFDDKNSCGLNYPKVGVVKLI